MLTLSFTLRQLRRSPAYIAAVVLSLAIGMAACVAVFSVLNATVFAAVPGVRDRSTTIHIRWMNGGELLTPVEFEILERELAPALDGLVAQGERRLPVVLPSGIITTNVAFVSEGLFATLGTAPIDGRLLDNSDFGGTAWPHAVLSETMWRRHYGADPSVIGSSIKVGGRAFTIVGISPAGFPGVGLTDRGADPDAVPQMWVPLTASAPDIPWLDVGGRLPRGGDVNAFRARLAVSATNAARESRVRHDPPVLRWFRGGLNWTSDPWGALLTIGVFLMVPLTILAIGCANVLNLQLARATDRTRELSVRRALGASPVQLLRLLGLEVVILTCVAGAAGWIGARLLLIGVQPLFAVPLTIDLSAVWLLLALVALVIAAAGWAPAVLAVRTVIAVGVKEGTDSIPHKRLRAALVVIQVAGSVVLLFISGLGVRTLQSQQDKLPVHAEDILTADFDLSDVRQPPPRSAAFVDGVLANLRDQGPIHAAAFATFLRYGQPIRFWLPRDGDTMRRNAYAGDVTNDWFDVMGIRFLAGRAFSDGGGLTEVVVNQALASRLGEQSAVIGTRLRLAGSDGSPQNREVVGVVEDQLMSPLPMALLPMPATPPSQLTLIVRTTDAATAFPIIRKAIQTTEPLAPLDTIRSLTVTVAQVFSGLRGIVIVGAALGSLAVLLAAMGQYAVLAFSVRKRTKEIGIRVAIGADEWSVVGLIAGQALSMTVAGLVLGFCLGVPVSIVMRSSFFGVSPFDPLAMTPVVGGMLIVAFAASILPALTAMRVDPVVALRDE